VKLTRQNVDKSIFVLVVRQTGTGKLGRLDLHVRQFLHYDTITHQYYIKDYTMPHWHDKKYVQLNLPQTEKIMTKN